MWNSVGISVSFLGLHFLVSENLFHYVALISIWNFSIDLPWRKVASPGQALYRSLLLLLSSLHTSVYRRSISTRLPSSRSLSKIRTSSVPCSSFLLNLIVISCWWHARWSQVFRKQPRLILLWWDWLRILSSWLATMTVRSMLYSNRSLAKTIWVTPIWFFGILKSLLWSIPILQTYNFLLEVMRSILYWVLIWFAWLLWATPSRLSSLRLPSRQEVISVLSK